MEILGLLTALPLAVVATGSEALELIERRRLMRKGLGYMDVQLLASAMLTAGARFWTRDKRLQASAQKLRVAFENH
ncbi:MAG: hypothetical protein ABI779_11155 [Acidobacteriota bacterium]